MWLFRTFIVRFLRREPLRCGVTLGGIALGVAVIVAIRLANGASLRGFETALDTMSGRASLEVIGAGVGIDETRVAGLGWLREYGAVSAVIEGDVLVRRADAPDPRAGEMMRVLGVDILKDRPIRDYSLIDTAEATRAHTAYDILNLLLDPASIITSEKFATRHGLAVGDRVIFTIGDRERVMVIRGLLKNEGPAKVIDGNFALLDIAAAQWALDRLGRIDRLEVKIDAAAAGGAGGAGSGAGADLDAIEAAIAQRLPEGLQVQRPERRGRQVERMLAAFHLNLTALSYIALVVGLFLVYNTVATSVITRRDEIGTLRALGATERQVLWLFLAEAVALALPGTALGIALGRLLAHGAVALTSTTVNALYIATAATPPALGATDVVVALLVGVPLSVAAAMVPALEASRVAPTSAMRGADQLATRYRLSWRQLAIPVAMFVAGGWLATFDARGGLPVAGYASAVALVFGAAGLVPVVLFVAVRVARRLLPRLAGVSGELAAGNLSGAIPRVGISVAALSVSLAMMVAIAVMVGSFRETVVYWVSQTLKADLFVGPSTRNNGARQSTLSAEVDAIVSAHPAVLAIDRFRTTTIVVDDAQVFLTAGDFEVMTTHGGLLFKAPADARAAMRAAVDRDAVIVSEPFANKHRKGIGDSVEIPTPAGRVRFRIEAVYFDYASDRGIIAMDRRTFARHFGALAPTGLTVYLRPGADAEQVRGELLARIGGERRVFVYTNRRLRTEVMRIFDSTFAITWALEVIAIVVAILGVAATLLTLMLERRKALAILRLVGADAAQVRRMVVVEAALIGGVSQVVGLVAGIALSLVLVFVINVQSFGWTIQFHVPVGFLAQMTLAILVATALAGLYPARRAARLASVGALHEE